MKKVILSAAILLFFASHAKAQVRENYLEVAMDKFRANDFDNSIMCFNEAEAATKGKDPSVFYYRGIAKLNLKRKEEACADFKKAKDLGYKEAENKLAESCK